MTWLLAALLVGPTWAQDDDDDEFSFLDEGDEAAAKTAAEAIDADDFDVDEDDDFGDWQDAPPPSERDPGPAPEFGQRSASIGTNKSTSLPYTVVGKEPLADNYEAKVVFADRDAVVVELPVLVARNPGDFGGRAYWVVGEVYADGMKVAESRQQVTSDAVAKAGPTLVFVKMLVPVPTASGQLEVRVGKTNSAAGAPEPLFTRQVAYQL